MPSVNVENQPGELTAVIGGFGAREYHVGVVKESHMLNLLIILALSPMNPVKTAKDIQPCIWPKCEKPQVELAQFQPCIWPKCAKPEVQLAQIDPCIWPKCEKPTLGL